MASSAPVGRHACVIGAGIVGCATAYALAREGWQVTLVDAHATPGQGASRANGAQLSYSYVEPLATPGALQALPGWLLRADSPLKWRPRAELAHVRWLASFVLACRSSQVQRTTQALLALSFLSRDTLHAWLQREPALALSTQHGRPGKLVIYRDGAKWPGVQRQLDSQRSLGCVQRLADAGECLALEPALRGAQGRPIAFGVWTESEEVIDAARLAESLARLSGARLLLGQRATGFDVESGAVRGLQLGDERLTADHFVLAAGPGLAALMRPLGAVPPIEPIKGYSATLQVVDSAAAPRVSITDHDRKIVHARLGDQLRVAGFAELCGADLRVEPARIDALCQAVEATFPGACDFADPRPWAGLRPATPSGRPFVGPTHYDRLWINAGHGSLGLTLACGSAALLASQMAGRVAPIDAEPFRWAPRRQATARNAALVDSSAG